MLGLQDIIQKHGLHLNKLTSKEYLWQSLGQARTSQKVLNTFSLFWQYTSIRQVLFFIWTRGPRALMVTWVSETLHWLLACQKSSYLHISCPINKNKRWQRKAALYKYCNQRDVENIDWVEDNAFSLWWLI